MPYRSAYSDSTRRTAIRLRREATFPERLLWSRLKRQQAGIRFLRQRPLGRYVADFYAPACKLVVELDGRSHEGRFAADLERERFLRGEGLRVLRLANDEGLADLSGVVAQIVTFAQVEGSATPTPLRGEPPPGGGF